MSMRKCKECGSQVSTKAEICPSCGAKQPKRTSTLTWLVCGVLVLGVLSAAGFRPPGTSSAVAAPESASAAAAQAAEKKAGNARDVAGAVAMKLVRDNMRDPDSLVWESVLSNADGSVVCIEYRAKNGFGGMNRAFFVVAGGKGSQNSAAWNKNCAKKTLFDVQANGEMLLKMTS
jgi:hypothetical protein